MRCKTCNHWEGGICHLYTIQSHGEDVELVNRIAFHEMENRLAKAKINKELRTPPDFGCINHSQNSL